MVFIIQILSGLLNFLVYAVLARVILQLVIPLLVQKKGSAPQFLLVLNSLVNQVTDPILNPIKRFLPATGMLDFSPLIAIVVLTVLADVVIPRLL